MQNIYVDLFVKLPIFGRVCVRGMIRVYNGPAMPGLMRVSVSKEEKDMLIFDVILPVAAVSDVVTRELTVAPEGQTPETRSLGGAETLAVGFKAPQDTNVALTLVDVDDAGNRSEARVQTVVLKDTIAPPLPGELGVNVTGEE